MFCIDVVTPAEEAVAIVPCGTVAKVDCDMPRLVRSCGIVVEARPIVFVSTSCCNLKSVPSGLKTLLTER